MRDWQAYRELDLRQLHQFFVETRLQPSLIGRHADADLPAKVLELRDKVEGECRRMFEIRKTRGSALQREVGKALVGMGYALVEEASCAFTGYSLDFVVFAPARPPQTPVPGFVTPVQGGVTSVGGDVGAGAEALPSSAAGGGLRASAGVVRGSVAAAGAGVSMAPTWVQGGVISPQV